MATDTRLEENGHPSAPQNFEEVLREQGFLVWGVRGCSMRPLLREGRDLVVIRRATEPPRKHDVVLFRAHGRYVLHRIVSYSPDSDTYTTRGDNNTATECVQARQVFGVMTAIVRGGRELPVSSLRYRLLSLLCVKALPARAAWAKLRRRLRSTSTQITTN